MSTDFVRRTQNLFCLSDDARRAEVAKDEQGAHAKVIDGLAESCLLLQEMLKSDELGRTQVDPDVWKYFRDLKANGKLGDFLKIERSLLEATALEQPAIDYVMRALERTIGLMIMHEGKLNSFWMNQVSIFSKLVCGQAAQLSRDRRRHVLLRRTFLAAGGSTVAMLNLFPPILIAPAISTASVSVGVWLIDKAAEGALDNWISGD